MDHKEASTAATDVQEFITDLDGGQFERMLSVALSQSAAAAVDNKKQAEVNVKLVLKPIEGTSQVQIAHTLVFRKPTQDGKTSEEATRATTLYVGRFGRLSLVPENQLSFITERDRENA